MPSTPSFRNSVATTFVINGRRTTLALEPPLLDDLRDIARREGTTMNALVSTIETANEAAGSPVNLSSATRIHIAAYYRRAAETAEAARNADLVSSAAEVESLHRARSKVRTPRANFRTPKAPSKLPKRQNTPHMLAAQ